MAASAGFTVAATGTSLVIWRRRPSLATVLVAGALLTVAAELAQGLAPGRGMQLRDVAMGFAGVLVCGLVIELVFERSSMVNALRAHTAAASAASFVLLALLIFDLGPPSVNVDVPDGESCPLTTASGAVVRITLGENVATVDGCLVTAVGGFGLFGPEGIRTLGVETVLVSSPLSELAQSINIPPPGVIALLGSADVGEVLQIRTRDQRVEVYGPTTGSVLRSSSLSDTLHPNTTHLLEVELTSNELVVWLDGVVISSVVVGDGWIEPLTESDAAEDLTLYLGNHPNRTLPFNGVIEWIEIETGK